MAPKSAASLRAFELYRSGMSRNEAVQTLRAEYPNMKAQRDIRTETLMTRRLHNSLPNMDVAQNNIEMASRASKRFERALGALSTFDMNQHVPDSVGAIAVQEPVVQNPCLCLVDRRRAGVSF